MEVYRRWRQRNLAVKLPPKAQWRCLPLRSKVQREGSSLGRIDFVNVQGEEGHAEAAEENEQILSGERHRNALHNFTTNHNGPTDAPEPSKSERELGEGRSGGGTKPSGAIALGLLAAGKLSRTA